VLGVAPGNDVFAKVLATENTCPSAEPRIVPLVETCSDVCTVWFPPLVTAVAVFVVPAPTVVEPEPPVVVLVLVPVVVPALAPPVVVEALPPVVVDVVVPVVVLDVGPLAVVVVVVPGACIVALVYGYVTWGMRPTT
jgi:hypothetical protein